MEQDENAPPPIKVSDHIFDLDFHPQQDVVAVGLVNGIVEIYKYSLESCDKVLRLRHHKTSCRCTTFSPNGNFLFTASSDMSLRAFGVDGSEAWAMPDAHKASINCLHTIDDNILATGDDEGTLKIWDLRSQKCIKSYKESEDFISSITTNPSKTHLLAGSGDGRLTVFDMATGTLWGKSDEQDDELLSITVVKDGKKVVCGSQDGVLMIWTWGTWGDISDRYPGHPESIDAILKVDEDTICTGSSDGIIRIVNIHPNKLIGVIGDHQDFPVERMKWSRDQSLIGSVSHNNTVMFWDASYLKEGGLADADEIEMEGGEQSSDDDSDEDMDDSSEEEKAPASKKSGKAKNLAQAGKKMASKASDFYSDL